MDPKGFIRPIHPFGHADPRPLPFRRRPPIHTVRQADNEQIDKAGRTGAPRIDRPPDHPDIGDRPVGKAEKGGDPDGKKSLPLAEGKCQTVDLQDHCVFTVEKGEILL
jgi:hypothetical protein